MRQALRPPATLALSTHPSTDTHTRDLTHGQKPKHQTKATKAPLNQKDSRSGIVISWTVHNSTITPKFDLRLTTIYTEHMQSTMKGHHTKTKAHRDNTNTSTCLNKSAPPKITRSGPMIPLLKHEITNNSRIQRILYQKHCVKLSASLRRNKPKTVPTKRTTRAF